MTDVYSLSTPGIPLSNQSAISTLIKAGVTIGIGPQGTSATPEISAWAVRNLRFDAGWVSKALVSLWRLY